MIIKITPYSNSFTLSEYLAGDGKHNEHTNHQIITTDPTLEVAYPTGTPYSLDTAKKLAKIIEAPNKEFGIFRHFTENGKKKSLAGYHIIFSLGTDEPAPTSEKWKAIIDDYCQAMGFDTENSFSPRLAISHGLSDKGNPHVHLMLSAKRFDGTTISDSNMRRKSVKTKQELEDKYGLKVIATERAGYSSKPWMQAEKQRQHFHKHNQVESHKLKQILMATAIAADSASEYKWLLEHLGVQVKVRYSKTSRTPIGYCVRLANSDCPWYQASKISNTLTLRRLSKEMGWKPSRMQSTPTTGQTSLDIGLIEWEKTFTRFASTSPQSPYWALRARETGQILATVATATGNLQIWEAANTIYKAGEESTRLLQNQGQILSGTRTIARANILARPFKQAHALKTLRYSQRIGATIARNKTLAGQHVLTQQVNQAIDKAINAITSIQQTAQPTPTNKPTNKPTNEQYLNL